MHPKTGKVTKAPKKLTAAHHGKMSGMSPREIPAGAMIYRRGGKLYMLENKVVGPGGRTMIHENFQDVFGMDHQY